jgi:hypothetical protein
MKRRQAWQQFGVRLVICVAILGGLYGAWWLAFGRSHNLTPSQKIAALRAAIDNSYIADGDLASFSENNAASSYDLDSLTAALQADLDQVQKRLKAAPPKVNQQLRQTIQAYVSQEQSALSAYRSASNIFGRAIAYDPQTDLGNAGAKLAERATAAQKGLQTAANGGEASSGLTATGSGLIGAVAETALQNSATCFGKLASDASQLQTCIKQYPATRQAAIANLLADSFSAAHRQQLAQTVPALLASLDKL